MEIDNVRLAWQWAVAHRRAREMGQAATSLRLFYDAQGWFHEAEAIFSQAAETLVREQRNGELVGAERPTEEQRTLEEVPGGGCVHEQECGIAPGHVLAQQGWFLLRLGLVGKAKDLLQHSLALLRPYGTRAELADTLQNLSMVVWVMGGYLEAQSLLQDGLMIFRERDSHWGIALCLASLGLVAQSLGNYGEAKLLMQQSLAIFKDIRDSRMTAMCLGYLSPLVAALGEYTKAKQLLGESLSLSREMGDRWSIALCLNYLGAMTYRGGPGEWPEAKRLHDESLTLYRELGDNWGIAVSQNYLGYVTYTLADYQAANEHFLAALQTATEAQLTPAALDALVGLATLQSQQPAGEIELDLVNQKERVIELLALVLNHPASSRDSKDRALHLLAHVDSELPSRVIAAAQERGQARRLDEVVAEILTEKRGH